MAYHPMRWATSQTADNPNHITAQKHILRVPKYPQTGSTISSTHFGVAVNGVLFVPRTAGCWGTVGHFHLRLDLDHNQSYLANVRVA